MKIPTILNHPEFLDAPLNYKWEDKTSTFYYVDAHNENIGKALWSLNHKATFGVATALAEWIFWRLSAHIKPIMINQSLESQWAGIIDKHYLIDWNFDKEYQSNPVQGPIWVMLKCIQYPREAYVNGYIFINKKIPNLAMLARHISPDKKLFDEWLSHILKKSAHYFPAQYSYEEILKDLKNHEGDIYNSTREPAIPRAFFWDLDYDFDKADNHKIINEFLSSLNYQDNQFLIKPRQMIEEGFMGTPYKY
ncbi:hypothetical protein RCS94_06320 [Orbaceae bacterium ac157xtp]